MGGWTCEMQSVARESWSMEPEPPELGKKMQVKDVMFKRIAYLQYEQRTLHATLFAVQLQHRCDGSFLPDIFHILSVLDQKLNVSIVIRRIMFSSNNMLACISLT